MPALGEFYTFPEVQKAHLVIGGMLSLAANAF